MQRFSFNRQQTGLFTDQQNQLVYSQEQLLPFIGYTFSKENVAKQIFKKEKSYTTEFRSILSTQLSLDYQKLEAHESVLSNIRILSKENSFTITTGHQLSIFTGPLYLIYKILHVIRLSEELTIEYPDYNFVPVFWMASEDHDFEEISTVELFGKTLTWESEDSGPVGRFSTEGLDSLRDDFLSFFQNCSDGDIQEILLNYRGENLAEATFRLLNDLFGEYGLVILNGDNPEFKKLFLPVMEKELKERFSFKAVHKTNEEMLKEGLKLQLTAREVNLFYINDNLRERIIHTENQFFIEGKGTVKLQEILEELNDHPERFSPNVVLRPLYQESILPNICYVGGGGELSYWLQLGEVFKSAQLPYPLIQSRVSILWIDQNISKQISDLSLVLEDLFEDINKVKKNYLSQAASEEIDFSNIDSSFELLTQNILDKFNKSDLGLLKFAEAETVRMTKQLDQIKEKLVKSVKSKHETSIKSIDRIYERLFPSGELQERRMNFFSLCSDGKVKQRLRTLHGMIDPFDPDFLIVRE